MTVESVRDNLISLIKRDLVGPGQGTKVQDSYDEEELIGEPAYLRYGAGILFPQNWKTQKPKTEASAQATDDIDTEPEVDSPLADCSHEGDSAPDVDLGADEDLLSDVNDDPVVTRFRRPPSSIGLSFLCDVPVEGILVTAKAAFYIQLKRSTEGAGPQNVHRRIPIDFRKLLFTGAGLPESTHTCTETIPVPISVSGKLELLIQCRNLGVNRKGRRRLITISMVNRGDCAEDSVSHPAYQCEIRVESQQERGFITPYPEADPDGGDEEEANLRLLYRHYKVYGVGHGCSVNWQMGSETYAAVIYTECIPSHEVKPIVPSILTGIGFNKTQYADPHKWEETKTELVNLCDQYEAWINEQRLTAANLNLPEPQTRAAMQNINGAVRCLRRMHEGLHRLDSDQQARSCFHLMNHAMLIQERRYSLPLRKFQLVDGNKLAIDPIDDKGLDDIHSQSGQSHAWYPFQIAFVLINICCTLDQQHQDREIVDIIWFPTGGGKTEAYLALTAFTIINSRMSRTTQGGTAVLMRYTLRLLTVQQFARAASLICALEYLRLRRLIPGDKAITAGLWLGNATTPGTRKDAKELLQKLAAGRPATSSFVLQRCPWCGAQIGEVRNNKSIRTPGLEESRKPSTVIFRCAYKQCYFYNTPLPISVVDEDIYENPTTLVVATVDKFATLPWRPAAKSLFGLGPHPTDPPELIIQDELHLISGPLGTMVGLYETAIEALCSSTEQGNRPVKIVASTATISHAVEQCHSLYGRKRSNIAVFPPQCLEAGQSFFAQFDDSRCGRMYLGIFANGLNSLVTAQIRTFALLLQGIAGLPDALNSYIDPYWTLIAYFNTLRELGYSRTLLSGEVSEHARVLARRYGWQPRKVDTRIVELTSRVPNDEIPRYLEQLGVNRTTSADAVDICLATNMISVGLDVPRLGLMALVGQPMHTSEYIQATSRVGRHKNGPGLVVTVYNTQRGRDQSHYERFHSYHASLYRYVEPTSVTPFAPPVRERALHAILIILARFWGNAHEAENPSPVPNAALVARIRDVVQRRVACVDPEEEDGVLADFDYVWQTWKEWEPQEYGAITGEYRTNNALMVAVSDVIGAGDHAHRSLPTPTSMRSVEPPCAGEIVRSSTKGE